MTAIFDTDGTSQNVPSANRMVGFGNDAGPAAPPQSFGGGSQLSAGGGYTVGGGGSSAFGGGSFSSPGGGGFAGGGRYEGYGNSAFASQGSKAPVGGAGAVAAAAAGAAVKGFEIAKDLGGKGLAVAGAAAVTAMPLVGKMAGVVSSKYNEVRRSLPFPNVLHCAATCDGLLRLPGWMDGVCLWAALQATKGFGGGNSSQQHQGLYATTTAGGSTGMGTQTSTSTQTGIITLHGISVPFTALSVPLTRWWLLVQFIQRAVPVVVPTRGASSRHLQQFLLGYQRWRLRLLGRGQCM